MPAPRPGQLGPRLRRAFFDRPASDVAAELVGARVLHRLVQGRRRLELLGRIVEVEAYLGDGSDPASHAHSGPSARNATMFDAPGTLYAYRSYGIHTCVNVVCRGRGVGEAVLLRALEPLAGVEAMVALRGIAEPKHRRAIATGPGRLAQALGLRLEDDGRSLLGRDLALYAAPAEAARAQIESGPRIGISKATELPLRFWDAASDCISPFRGPRRPAAAAGRTRATRR